MNLQYMTILPALFTMTWAVTAKIQKKKYYDLFLILACAIALIYNGVIVYLTVCGHELSLGAHLVQLFLSSCIIPFAYMYFANTVGRPARNTTTTVLWMLVPITFLPNINIFLNEPHSFMESDFQLMKINIINNGETLISIYTADFIITVQAIITSLRIIPYSRRLRRYGCSLGKCGKVFFIWWLLAIIFSVSFSLVHVESFTQIESWLYFIMYSFLISMIYIMIALGKDFSIDISKSAEMEAEDLRTLLIQNRERAVKMRKIMKEEKLYTISGYRSEDMIQRLNTNRTYFAKMMNAEFGMSFSKYINQERIKYAKKLIKTTGLSMEEIAQQSGFGDASYMNRKFKEEYGKTARQWINDLDN